MEKKTLVLAVWLLGALATTIARPLPLPEPQNDYADDPDRLESHQIIRFPADTTTMDTNSGTQDTHDLDGSPGLKRLALIFEVLGGLIAVLLFVFGIVVAIWKWCVDGARNPEEGFALFRENLAAFFALLNVLRRFRI